MIRLLLLIAATLAGLFLMLAVLGGGERAPVASTPPAPASPGAGEILRDILAEQPPAPQPAKLVQAQTQTPQQVQRFPGPPLRPSPEHAGGTPRAAPESGAQPAAGLHVSGNRVNMRAGPSTGDRVVAVLEAGTPVEALGPTDGPWVNIRIPDGRSGYVSGQFLAGN